MEKNSTEDTRQTNSCDFLPMKLFLHTTNGITLERTEVHSS